MLLAGVVLVSMIRPRQAVKVKGTELAVGFQDGAWPVAPVTQPFVPHTRAWDDLREALSPVARPPAGSV